MKESKTKKRYKEADGKHWIEVRVRYASQLFDSRDPAPFRERDLDEDFVEYIVSAAREFSKSTLIKLVIYVDEMRKDEISEPMIRDAIREYLTYRIELQTGELRAFIKRAQFFLFLGVVTLGIFLGISQSIKVPSAPGILGILREGLVIFGWVSVWKPIELILFDWYPLVEYRTLLRRLLEAEVEVRFASEKTA